MYELKLPGVPPSLNTLKGEHWARAQRRKKAMEGDLYILLLQAEVPKKLNRVQASATLYFRSDRRRDEGNFRPVLEKALGDALQLGWLPDDTPDHFRFGELRFEVRPGKPQETVIELEVE